MVQGFKGFILIAAVLAGGVVFTQPQAGPRPGVDWPGFRGINASGVDDGKALPGSVPEGMEAPC